MNIVDRFSENLTAIEYPKEKTSWNIAGILKGKNAFYKFDVRGIVKESVNRGYKTGRLNSKADKMVFEFKDKWIILDMEELNNHVKKNKLKNLELSNLIKSLEWTIKISKGNIFQEEFLQISEHYKSNLDLYSSWSATYGKGDYHVPHNHGSTGYCGILYLNMHKKSPTTCYMQPWNCDRDRSIIYEPKAEVGDIVIVPQFIVHFTRPNPLPFKKRIISFDFRLQ